MSARTWVFLIIIPALMLLGSLLLAVLTYAKRLEWLERSAPAWTMLNTIASLATIISISLAVGFHFFSEEKREVERRLESQALLDDLKIEIQKNRAYCSNFLADKDRYIAERQYPLWSLRTIMIERVLRSGLFTDTRTSSGLFELYHITLQYNVLLEGLRNPSLWPNPEWDKHLRSTVQNLTEKSSLMHQAYDQMEEQLQKVTGSRGLKY